jgi:hypothetical protein
MQLRTIVDSLFKHSIFGVEATQTMLQETYVNYFFKDMRNKFAPWKVLKAIDLSSVGGLNYNGIETLQRVKNLTRYERGVLPSRSSVQRIAYELYEHHFRKKGRILVRCIR